MEIDDFYESNYNNVDPVRTSYGTLPLFLNEYLSKVKPKPYKGGRPGWLPNAERVRNYLFQNHFNSDYTSRSGPMVIGHDGSLLSLKTAQVDHIIPWNKIQERLLYEFRGEKADGTVWACVSRLPLEDGKLKKGVDYVDDPIVLDQYGEDVLYRFTNVGATKYFHTIENLRPVSGSTNSKRNNRTDASLGIIPCEFINPDLNKKLSRLSASVNEYVQQVVSLMQEYETDEERSIHVDVFIEETDNLIRSMEDANRYLFD